MTHTEKATFADRASCMGLSFGQFFCEAGAAYANSGQEESVDSGALDAALNQLEISTTCTEAVLDSALTTVILINHRVEEMASLMKEQQHRIDDLNGRLIRLETMFEIALNLSSVQLILQ